MEKQQLNLNQPLLSVRRAPLLSDPSDVSGWKTLDSKPTLPPLPYYKSELNSGPIRNPGVVPFQWEQMPGRPKHENSRPKDNVRKSAVAPKLPPGRIANQKKKPIIKTSKDSPGSEKETKEKDISTGEDDNLAFVDADETLSRKELLFNSGVRGTPHAVSRKDPGVRGELKPVKKVIKWKPQSPHYSSHRNVHAKDDDGEENEDECAGMVDISVKLCGLLPKFCLLNPTPGMRDHTQAISSVRSVRTRSPAYTDSCRKSENKDRIQCHTGHMKRVPHQSDSKNEPSINENIGSRSKLPLEDGSPQFPDKEERFIGLYQQCIDLKAGKHVLRDNNGVTTFRELISLDAAQENTSPPNPAIEKTLYVDHEPIELSRNSISSSPESEGRNQSVDSLQDINSMICLYEKQIIHPKTSEKSFQNVREDLHRDQIFNLDVVLPQRKQLVKEGNHESGLPVLGSLLPKSPSESWLSRTLPSIPTKKPYSKLAFRPSPVDPKRERMLRSPNLQ